MADLRGTVTRTFEVLGIEMSEELPTAINAAELRSPRSGHLVRLDDWGEAVLEAFSDGSRRYGYRTVIGSALPICPAGQGTDPGQIPPPSIDERGRPKKRAAPPFGRAALNGREGLVPQPASSAPVQWQGARYPSGTCGHRH